MRQKPGRTIIPLGVFPELHELETAAVFLAQGLDVEFLVPNRTKGARTPDVKINNILWEMKSPRVSSKKTIANALRRAVKQSHNVIIDARAMKIPESDIERELMRNVPLIKSLKRLILISRTGEIIDLKR